MCGLHFRTGQRGGHAQRANMVMHWYHWLIFFGLNAVLEWIWYSL